MVYILLGTGFEEIEAIAPADLLRRAGVEVQFVGVNGPVVAGAHGIEVKADITLSEVNLEGLELLIVPGGSDGVQSISESQTALSLLKNAYKKGCYLSAICAGPTVLAKIGVLEHCNATCYPGMEAELGSSVAPVDENVVMDGHIITGRAPGAAIDFGLALVRVLCGVEIAKMVREEIHYESR